MKRISFTFYMNKTTHLGLIIFIVLMLVFISGCNNVLQNSSQTSANNEQNVTGSNKKSNKLSVGEKKAPSIKMGLKTLSTNDFSIQLPDGWKYEVNPSNLDFGMIAYDPDHPERKIFYYYEFNPFMKSDAARDLFKNSYGANNIFASCPVLNTAKVSEFYTKWNEYADFLNKQGLNAAIMKFKKLDIVETHQLDNYLSSYSLDSSVVRAHLTLENSNIPCEGLFSGSVVSLGTYYQNGVDCSPLMVYNVMGIMAPADEFLQLQEILANSLKTFTFSESYVQSYVKKSNDATKAILDNARTMQAAYDSYNAAWHSRQPVNDAISQKNSDATLGYDRLYDEETGEIYRAEVGWYDHYDLHRNEYNKSQLHPIENNDYDRYSNEIDYYIYK